MVNTQKTNYVYQTIFLPLASYLVEFKTALVLVAIFHFFGNVSRITFFRHGLDWNILLVFGIPSIALSLIDATLVGNLSQTFLKLLLGTFLIVFSVLFLIKPKIEPKPAIVPRISEKKPSMIRIIYSSSRLRGIALNVIKDIELMNSNGLS